MALEIFMFTGIVVFFSLTSFHSEGHGMAAGVQSILPPLSGLCLELLNLSRAAQQKHRNLQQYFPPAGQSLTPKHGADSWLPTCKHGLQPDTDFSR